MRILGITNLILGFAMMYVGQDNKDPLFMILGTAIWATGAYLTFHKAQQ